MPGITMEPLSNMAASLSKAAVESGAPGFSYAQAAKGRAASANASATQSNSAASGSNTPSKVSVSTADTPTASIDGTNGADVDRSVTSNEELLSGRDVQVSDLANNTTTLHLSPSPSFGTSSTQNLPIEDEVALPPHLAEASWRSPRPKTPSEHQTEGSERRGKGKRKKDRAAGKEPEQDKEKEEIKPEVFVAAPPPAVNIWHQRKEAQAAKVKPNDSLLAPANEATGNSSVPEQPSKSVDQKKKARPISSDGTAAPNGTAGKTHKKGSDGIGKKEESRRAAPRGARVVEKDEKSLSSQTLPPVADGIAWPTPETALEEEKRKVQDKAEKDDAEDPSLSKPRSKKEWVSVPFTPSVTFNTPLPARGGRGRGGGRGGRETGGRGGHASSGSVSGEKAFTSPAANNSGFESREHSADIDSATRATSLPPNSKRTGESTTSSRDQRKSSASFEKSKVDLLKPDTRQSGALEESKVHPTDGIQTSTQQALAVSVNNFTGEKADYSERSPLDSQAKVTSGERKIDTNLRTGDQYNGNGQGQAREKGEGRGRGGYNRNRGGHNNFANGQAPFANGHSQQTSNGYGLRQNSVPFSPPLQAQQQFINGFMANGQRPRNGPPRAQSIPTNSQHMYARYPQNGNGNMQQMSMPGQNMYDFPGQNISQFVDWSVFPMVVMQLDYYFSIDNLCKDVFLRKHMDSQGFVFLSFISQFKRIQSLTPEFEVLRIACQESEIIEIVIGDDGLDRVRRLDGWEKWVMPLEERDEAARIPGPQQFFRQKSQLQNSNSPMTQRIGGQRHPVMSPPLFSPTIADPTFRAYLAGPAPVSMANGTQFSEYGHQTESPLSAAVPDFSPGLTIHDKLGYSEDEITFTDPEVEQLIIVYNQQDTSEVKAKAPYHSAASRTFSNGSIDSRTVNEEIAELERRQSQPNGNQTSDSSPNSRRHAHSPASPRGELSPTRLVFGNAPPVMWVKGQNDHVPISGANKDGNKTESYNVVRDRALRSRESPVDAGAINYDMKILYTFWPHFLVRNFNPHMYEEFRNLALEDAQQRQDMSGMSSLMIFYDEILNSRRKTIHETLARHYVEAVRAESELSQKERPGLAKLRAAWRNGALDMKSRKKVADFLDSTLKEELER